MIRRCFYFLLRLRSNATFHRDEFRLVWSVLIIRGMRLPLKFFISHRKYTPFPVKIIGCLFSCRFSRDYFSNNYYQKWSVLSVWNKKRNLSHTVFLKKTVPWKGIIELRVQYILSKLITLTRFCNGLHPLRKHACTLNAIGTRNEMCASFCPTNSKENSRYRPEYIVQNILKFFIFYQI